MNKDIKKNGIYEEKVLNDLHCGLIEYDEFKDADFEDKEAIQYDFKDTIVLGVNGVELQVNRLYVNDVDKEVIIFFKEINDNNPPVFYEIANIKVDNINEFCFYKDIK